MTTVEIRTLSGSSLAVGSSGVEADASEAEILELIQHADPVAEIPNSLRLGTQVKLGNIRSITRR